jgi:hypothetical protein
MSVSRKLQANPGVFCDRKLGWSMVQENAGGAGFEAQAFEIGAQGQGMSGRPVGYADDLKTID